MEKIIVDSIANLIVISMGIYLLNAGWQIYSLKSKKLLITTRMSLYILQLVKGRKAREEKETELLEPRSAKKYGVYAILAGGIFLFEAILRIILMLR
jgi:TRAP-type C4-dicarboxylate transport system permease small subunit